MIQNETFKMRISPEDRKMLRDVARHFERSQGDTIRVIVREVYQHIKTESALSVEDPKPKQRQVHATA